MLPLPKHRTPEYIYKRYVDVILRHDAEGAITPLSIEWADGDTCGSYKITQVLYARPESSIGAGGFGMMYQIIVNGKTTKLFYSDFDNKWFVEAKRPIPIDYTR